MFRNHFLQTPRAPHGQENLTASNTILPLVKTSLLSSTAADLLNTRNFLVICTGPASKPLPRLLNPASVVSSISKFRYPPSLCPKCTFPSYLHQGVRQIKSTDLNPVYCFISPPSLSALRNRLTGRGTETEAAVEKRLKTALVEIDYAQLPGAHDHIIVNDDLDRAYALFESIAFGNPIPSDPLPPFDQRTDRTE